MSFTWECAYTFITFGDFDQGSVKEIGTYYSYCHQIITYGAALLTGC